MIRRRLRLRAPGAVTPEATSLEHAHINPRKGVEKKGAKLETETETAFDETPRKIAK